jgi:IclR family transcriptional regulator, KDG regulon repressor
MMQPPAHKSRKVIASVQRALDILNLFQGSSAELGNAEIAKRLGLDPGTVAGLVATLRVNNYLDQNSANRKYRLGLKLAERASILLEQLDLRKTAAPQLEKLRDWCNESVNLVIRDGQEVVYIERLFGSHALGIRSELGKRAPVHSTALGKAIAAYLPQEEAQTYLSRYRYFAVTSHTITNPDQFLKALGIIRKTGYAVDEEENELGGRCVAAPIFNHAGYPVAAVSVSVPVQRLPREKVALFGEKIKAAAEAISSSLGHQMK